VNVGPRIKSPVSRIFYTDWKLLHIHLHPRVVQVARELLVNTYGSAKDPDFLHPFEPFSSVQAYVDRICWRLPDCIREEGGLGLHLDRNPVDPYLSAEAAALAGKLVASEAPASTSSAAAANKMPKGCTIRSGLGKWRPIQAFVCLTDHFGGDSGGLRVVPGFHHRIDAYFKGKVSEGNGGEFYRMNSVQHDTLQRECQPVFASAGAMILWDTRTPHATAAKLAGSDTREVVYTGFLPDTQLNRAYIKRQLEAIRQNKPAPAYEEQQPTAKVETSDRNWDEAQLTDEQKQLLGITKM